MHKSPLTKEIVTPTMKGVIEEKFSAPNEPISLTLDKVASAIIGVPSKNEKRAASALENPNRRPAVIVMPERLTPGIKAKA